MFIFHQWDTVGTYVQPSAFFPVIGTVFSGSFHTAICILPVPQYPASSCPGGVRHVPSFSQALAFVCSFSFPLHVGEQSVLPSVGCTIEQTTHELDRPSVVGSKRRTNQSATRGIFCQLFSSQPDQNVNTSFLLAFGFLCFSS